MPEMEDSRPHLELRREAPVVERRTRRGFSGGSPPDDPRRHGAMLGERLQEAREMAETDIGGYDDRRGIVAARTWQPHGPYAVRLELDHGRADASTRVCLEDLLGVMLDVTRIRCLRSMR